MANYTEKAIFRAFEALLEEKPFDKITVSAIVSKSEVSANTFYYHFQDIYDLLDKWLDRKRNHFFALTQLSGDWTDRLKILLHAMQERLERYVFPSVESQVYDYIEKSTTDIRITDEARKLITGFFCCSLLGYVMKFLWVNMKVDIDSSVDDLSLLFSGALEAMLREKKAQ